MLCYLTEHFFNFDKKQDWLKPVSRVLLILIVFFNVVTVSGTFVWNKCIIWHVELCQVISKSNKILFSINQHVCSDLLSILTVVVIFFYKETSHSPQTLLYSVYIVLVGIHKQTVIDCVKYYGIYYVFI